MITVTLTEEEMEIIFVALSREAAVTIWSVADAFLKDGEVSELNARMTMIDSLMRKLKASKEAERWPRPMRSRRGARSAGARTSWRS